MKKIITDSKTGKTKVITVNEEPTKTQQSYRDMVNINKIMKKYKETGMITHLNSKTGIYADLTSLPSYEESLQAVITAQNAFMDLPADLRSRFQNDPQQLISFLADVNNKEEAIKLGLIKKPVKNDEIKNDDKTQKSQNPASPS